MNVQSSVTAFAHIVLDHKMETVIHPAVEICTLSIDFGIIGQTRHTNRMEPDRIAARKLSLDWLSVITALICALLVRLGIISHIPW